MPVQVDMGGFLFGFNHVGLSAFVYLVNRCCLLFIVVNRVVVCIVRLDDSCQSSSHP